MYHIRCSVAQWASNNTEVERLQRFTTAHSFHQADETVQSSQAEIQAEHEKLESLKEQQVQSGAEVTELETEIEDLSAVQQKEMGSEFKAVEKEATNLSKAMVSPLSACCPCLLRPLAGASLEPTA